MPVIKKQISFITLYKGLNASFLKNKSPSKKLKEKTIHGLRVNIKHLRALLHLTQQFGKTNNSVAEILKQLKPVFKAGGEMRTATINITLLKNISGTEPFIKYLIKQEKDGGKKLAKALNDFNNSLFKKHSDNIIKSIKSVKHDVIVIKSLNYIDAKKNHIKTFLNKPVSDADLHEIRKESKFIKTSLQILYKVTGQKLFKVQLKELTELEEAIGVWHDKAVLFDELTLFNKKHKADKKLITFMAQLQDENNFLKTQIVGLLKIYLN